MQQTAAILPLALLTRPSRSGMPELAGWWKSPLEGHTDSINSVGYSPDGSHVVSSSSDKTIRIWNARTG
ncbi:hypothetical protein M404DRAFT_595910 [Pisolithus tinctorius Marx 270]|uniref:Uncharacterized protein n=1 Tax=Pisolithus tinctorius Marx 270 TaxID=870435 RepID=A0A0C3KW06_PISTI|nr:hypothetical protein M404DRAFT_595910 [Pisolithus tinctorius Marx 270]